MGGSFFYFFKIHLYARRSRLYNFFTLWYNYNGESSLSFLYITGGETRRFAVYFRPDLRYDIIGGVLLLKK